MKIVLMLLLWQYHGTQITVILNNLMWVVETIESKLHLFYCSFFFQYFTLKFPPSLNMFFANIVHNNLLLDRI